MARDYRTIARALILATSLIALGVTLHAAEGQPTDTPATQAAPLAAPATAPASATPNSVQAVIQSPVAGIAGTKAVKIGYADMLRIAEESPSGKAAKARFKVKTEKFQTQLAAKQKQLEKQKAALEAKLPTLPPDQRKSKVKEFEKKVDEYRRFGQNAEKELLPLQEELMRSITKEIEKAAESYGKANGFTAIIVRKELLFLGDGVETEEVTDALLKLMK